ncbi:MAG: cation diffusion facilitator family transporter [Flavobacteriales bacterium]|nr:cation diffusion facilitator family transporter [Flavobacteriales bacterium]
MSVKRDNVRLQFLILTLGFVLMGIKFFTWYLTRSNTILTDALESIVNVLAGGFALFALWLSARPKDEDHPYGHGKIEFISAGFEGALILLAGLSIIAKSIYNLFYPAEISSLDLGIYLSVATGAANYLFGVVLEKRGRKVRSLAMVASGQHLKSDGYTSAGMIAGLLLIILTDILWLDSAIAIVMGSVIVFMGGKIVRKSLAGIMDEADLEVIDEMLEILNRNRKENWIDVHNLRVIKYGTTYHIDSHVTLPWYIDLKMAHHQIEEMAKIIESEAQNDVEFFIHTDPCTDDSCAICEIKDCPARKMKFEKKINWSRTTLLANLKHTRDTQS